MDGFRPATTDDATALGRIHLAAATVAYAGIFPADAVPPTVEQLAGEWAALIAEPHSIVLVATVDDEPVGAVACIPMTRPDDEVPSGWTLARLYVDPGHWSKGLGARLHDLALAKLAVVAEPPDAINLWVLEHNDKARAFYESRGWTLVLDRYLANEPPHVRDVLYRRPIRSSW